MKKMKSGKGVYQILTDHIIQLLEQGTIPWKQPWREKEPPQNLLNRIPYRGINLMFLSSFNFERNLFLTFNQIKSLSASINPGEKPLPVIFWKWPKVGTSKEDQTMEEPAESMKVYPILRYYSVYNLSQCSNVPQKLIPGIEFRGNEPIKECVRIVENMPQIPTIQFIDHRAYYSPVRDVVNVPNIRFFNSSEDYYATLFHELVHSTGHSKRLDRKEGMESISFGSDRYSFEELIAEMGACFLEAEAGISALTIENNAAYINGWLDKLRKNNRFLVFASAKAQKAADYILGSHGNETEYPATPALISDHVSDHLIYHDKS